MKGKTVWGIGQVVVKSNHVAKFIYVIVSKLHLSYF